MTWLRVGAAGALLLVLLAAYSFIQRVPAGGAAILESGSAGSPPRLLRPGTHFRPPGSRVTVYRELSGASSGEVMVTPASGGEFPLSYEVTGSLDPERLAEVHAAVAGRPLPDFLQAQAGALLRELAASAGAVDLLSPAFREKAGAEIAAAMKRGGLAEATVTVGPPDDETLMAAAQYLGARGEAYKVRQTVSEKLLGPDGARSWKLLTAMGYINESEKLLTEAERSYLDALAIEPGAIPPMTQLVTLYSAVQDWPTLRRILDAALAARPDSPQHLNWAAMVLNRQGDMAGAERMLARGLEVDPDNHIMMTNLGALMMKQGRADEGLELFRKAAEAAPDSQQALFNLGSALAAGQRFADALPVLERAAEAGPMSAPLARALGAVLEQTGDRARAAEYLRQAESLEAAQPRPPSRSKGGAPAPGGA